MPIALDPNAQFSIVLKSDLEKPHPPAFKFRYLSGRDWMNLADLHDSVSGSQSGREALLKIFDSIRVALVGWENMGMDYEPKKLEDILNPGEAKELLEGVMAGIMPGPAEKKA